MNPQQEIQELEDLISQLLFGLQEVMSSGEILSDEFQALIAQELQLTLVRIDELRSENPVEELPPTLGQEPPLNQQMASSNVYAFGYDPEKERLLVKFQGNDGEGQGSVYGYDGVPQVIFDLFQKGAIPARTDGQNKWGKWWKGKVPSLGASLYTLIKNGPYPYQRLS